MSAKQIIKYWHKNFVQIGIREELILAYMAYIRKLLEKEVPIIFDFRHLCLLLGKQPSYVASVVNSNKTHYHFFEISKRDGGTRTICAPYVSLKEMQHWVYQNILSRVPISQFAHGFVQNRSIITNAKIHLGQNHFLKVDLKDFFPSIKINSVINVFRSLGYTHKVSYYLASICCYEDFLPQGAPTSPVLSNIIAANLDKRLVAFSKKNNLRYSRYADDLAFSGDYIPAKYIDYIASIIKSSGFVLNEKKTFLQQNKSKRIVTGISIADKTLKVPREYKRQLKSEIYYIRKIGLVKYCKTKKIRDPEYLSAVIGKIRFWSNVEPDCRFAQDALREFCNLRDGYNTTESSKDNFIAT